MLTDLAPTAVGVSLIQPARLGELVFRVLKSLGWHWERMRRTHAERVARHWLVLAVATLLSRSRTARASRMPSLMALLPANLLAPRPFPPAPGRLTVSVFARVWPGCSDPLLRRQRLVSALLGLLPIPSRCPRAELPSPLRTGEGLGVRVF